MTTVCGDALDSPFPAGSFDILFRGGTLIATVMSSLPAWMAFDPLPVLDNFEESNEARRTRRSEDGQNEDLASFVDG